MYYLISIFPYTIMAKNIGTLVISIRKCNPAFFWKCFGINMFIYFLHWNNTKKTEEKSNLIQFHTEPQKNAPNQIIGTHKLIFGSTPLEKKYWNQSVPVTMNEFLIALYWNVGPQISPQVFCGIQIWTHFRTRFGVLFEVCFGSLSCWKTNDLWWSPQLFESGHNVAPQNDLVISRFHDTVHTVKTSSARSNPKSSLNLHHVWL